MAENTEYEALTPETLAKRLSGIKVLNEKVGENSDLWEVAEIGDGNLNLVFIISGKNGKAIVKQALPYVRLVGESWPLPLYRAFYEYNALERMAQRHPGSTPEIYYFDDTQAIIVMEYLDGHTILRQKLIAGEKVQGLAEFLGQFCARTAFRGSELSMQSANKKSDVALFSGNVEIPAITEALVFTDPYYEAEQNHHTKQLDRLISVLRRDVGLKIKVQKALQRFVSNSETMIHGDLHSGSIMCTDQTSRVIDPEFVQYGPMGFDVGMLCANFFMAYFSQPAHRQSGLEEYQEWILNIILEIFDVFNAEFRVLWANERRGLLYPPVLFEDQDHDAMAACEIVLKDIWSDAWTYCGIEMHRRCLSLAHNADFEEISNSVERASLEARNIEMGAHLIRSAGAFDNAAEVCEVARAHNRRDFL